MARDVGVRKSERITPPDRLHAYDSPGIEIFRCLDFVSMTGNACHGKLDFPVCHVLYLNLGAGRIPYVTELLRESAFLSVRADGRDGKVIGDTVGKPGNSDGCHVADGHVLRVIATDGAIIKMVAD